LDASALVKRYVAEPGSDLVREAMAHAETWLMCRAGFVETVRAVELAGGTTAAKAVTTEWPALAVIEVDQRLVEDAARLALTHDLRSLDALHLAAALLLPGEGLVFASWDRGQHMAAGAEGLRLMPDAIA
jgi:predicted nucleic acid-binding protein